MNGAQWWLMLDRAGFQTAWLLLSALWQSSILLAAAGLLAYALRRRRASVRHAILAGAILCSPLIPLLGLAASRSGTPQAPIPVMPSYSAPVVPAYSAPVVRTYPVPAMPAGPILTEAPAGAEIDRTPALPAVTAQPQEAPLAMLDCPWALALLAYAAGAGGLLCLVAVGKYRIGRWARRGRVVTDPRLLGIFRDARRRLGLGRDFTVVENERILSPMTVGTLHPVILMPAGLAEDSSDDDLQAVALHELTHVQRCDSLLLTLLSLVRAVLFFHPLVHMACRQASALAENACDDAVLEATGQPVPYAKMLARLAEQLPRHAFTTEMAAGIVWSKGSFLRRVEAILSDRRDEIRKLSGAALLATLLAAMIPVALALALPLSERGEGQAAANSAATQPASVQPVTTPSALPAGDPRRGAAVTAELDKAQYYLGENVLLKWRIHNAGDQAFKVSMGGDGRTPGARRAIRFKVECLDEHGRKMADPYPNPMNMGGPGNDPTLAPGQDFLEDLQLMRYREFSGTGKYTIEVYHDLGWEKDPARRFGDGTDHSEIPPGGRLSPVATTTVRLVMPDRRQARQVVDAMLALPADANRTWGKWGKPFADFELLRYPVYLPIMKELAQKGDARALGAIGAMAFPEATGALLELLNHKNPAIAAKAGDLLLWRTFYGQGTAPSRGKYLVERSWTDELKTAALVPAWKLLAGNDREGIIRGARLVQSLGGKDDLPALIRVMDRVLPAFKDDPTEQAAYLRPATASDALVDAAGQLIGRGAQPSISAATPGQAVAFLIGLRLKGDFRPAGWRGRAVGLIDHKIPFLRYVALQNMPLPLDDTAVAAVARAIKSDFAPVQGAACDLAAKAKSPAFRPPLLDVLQTTDNHWVLRSAFTAAAQCGTDNDIRLEVCVGRMGRYTNDMNMLLLSLLIDGSIEHEGGRGWREIEDWTSILPGIQKAWMDFIAANRQALRDGKRFRIAQPPVTAEMFPPGFVFARAGKPAWPSPTPPTPLTPAQLDHLESQSYEFVKRSVLFRFKRWRESQPKTAAELEKYATEIVINLDQPEMLLKDGTDRVLRAGLSSSFAWTVYRVTPEGAQPLKAPVRLKLPGLASQVNICKEVFVLQGKLEGGRGVFADITTNGLRFSAGKGVADLASYQFPEKQYTPTSDFIEQSLLIARPVVTAPPAAKLPAKNLIWGEAVDGIRCAVRPAKASFAPDEDIVVDVVYSNVSEGPITVCVFPDPLYTWVALRVRDDKGKSVAGGAHGTGTRPTLKKSDFVTLLPGQIASFRQVIRYNPKAPVKPGRCFIQAEINKINRMDKHLRGLSEFIQKHGLPEPWCSTIQSPKTPIIIASQPGVRPSSRQAPQPARPVTKAAIDERIRALGSGVYKDRERAQQWLIDLGDQAVDALRDVAKGTGEASVRAKAALAEIGRRKLTKFFVGLPVRMPPGLPETPDTSVRLEWIKALGELKDLRTTGILLDCMDDKGGVREVAGEVLREMSGQTFGDDPKQWRTWWAEVQNPKESTATLLRRLDDPRVEVRREAIWKLAMLGDPAALDALVERFVNRSGGEPKGKSVMDEKMHWADLPHLRSALVCMGPAAGAKMVRVSGYGWRICESALAAALQIGGQAVIDEAIRQVQGEDPSGREGGAKVLTELRPLSGVLPLMRALDNSRFHDSVVDRALVTYDETAVPQLRKAWEDKTLGKGTRLAAAILLAHHGDDVGMSELADIAAKGTRSLMVATVSRMGKTRNPKFLPLIAKALARKDSQQAVAYAAAFCGGKEALPMLRQALEHPDKGVRYGAKVWVEKLSQADEGPSEEEIMKIRNRKWK